MPLVQRRCVLELQNTNVKSNSPVIAITSGKNVIEALKTLLRRQYLEKPSEMVPRLRLNVNRKS